MQVQSEISPASWRFWRAYRQAELCRLYHLSDCVAQYIVGLVGCAQYFDLQLNIVVQ